jgi:hypothetical protein
VHAANGEALAEQSSELLAYGVVGALEAGFATQRAAQLVERRVARHAMQSVGVAFIIQAEKLVNVLQ